MNQENDPSKNQDKSEITKRLKNFDPVDRLKYEDQNSKSGGSQLVVNPFQNLKDVIYLLIIIVLAVILTIQNTIAGDSGKLKRTQGELSQSKQEYKLLKQQTGQILCNSLIPDIQRLEKLASEKRQDEFSVYAQINGKPFCSNLTSTARN